jgi:hypothetical protein
MGKEKTFTLRLSLEEHTLWVENAKRERLSLAEWVRRAVEAKLSSGEDGTKPSTWTQSGQPDSPELSDELGVEEVAVGAAPVDEGLGEPIGEPPASTPIPPPAVSARQAAEALTKLAQGAPPRREFKPDFKPVKKEKKKR